MENLLRDGIWQFVGVILALIAIAITIVQRNRKRFAYEIISETPVVSTSDEVEGKIQILFEGKPVKKVHLLIIRLTNIGNVPITRNDFEREVSFVFDDKVQILTHEISATRPENLGAEFITVNNTIVMRPILLNGGDTITIKSLLSDFDYNVKIDGRIIGVKTIEKRLDTSQLSNKLNVAFILLVIAGVYFYFTENGALLVFVMGILFIIAFAQIILALSEGKKFNR